MLQDESTQTVYLKDYQPPQYLVEDIQLSFNINDGHTVVESSMQMVRNPQAENLDKTVILQGEALELTSLVVDGSDLSINDYQLDDQALSFQAPGERFTVKTTSIIHPEENTALEGMYHSGRMYCTQCEAEGFRKITWFPDRPDVMAVFTTRLEADITACPVLLSNGNLLESGELDDGRHYAVWQDPFPKPSYLFALVAGDLKAIKGSHTTPSGKQVELNIFVEEENVDKCDHAMRSLINAMRWDESSYGREYDLDVYNIVAVNDFNMGAMENKGLNIFNSKYVLARQDTATDRDFQGIESVIAHEYFHNWTGNRITCRDWFQLSLKEGFTVFRDQCFSADMGSHDVKRIEDVRMLRTHQFAEDAGPMAHPVRPSSYMEINNFYTLTVYEKGAEVVRMQSNLLGPKKFRQATDLYFERFDGQAVTTDDFVKCMQDVLGRDLSQFKHWYDYAGTPELKVTSSYDADQCRYTLSVKQACPDTPGQNNKPPFYIPFAVGLLSSEGNDLIGTRMLEVTEKEQQFVFENIAEEPCPSLLRGFSAPVTVKYDYSDASLMFLMQKDTDGFSRWDASQQLSQRILLLLVKQQQSQQPMAVPIEYLSVVASILGEQDTDKALLAEILTLPSESYIGDLMQQVDVDAIHQAREYLRSEIANNLDAEIFELYKRLQDNGNFNISSAAMARRALKNTLLGYLVKSQRQESIDLCMQQYQESDNMTDTLSAFVVITDSDLPQRQSVIKDFEAKWHHDPLVMDKWFSAQAVSSGTDVLDNVKSLMKHPGFSMTNPNKVRSLIGAFCSANPANFHRLDGEGYKLLADVVLELDQLNAQVAARMIRLMSRWRRYDKQRQALMKQQLERIVNADNLSRDVFEIASKSLA